MGSRSLLNGTLLLSVLCAGCTSESSKPQREAPAAAVENATDGAADATAKDLAAILNVEPDQSFSHAQPVFVDCAVTSGIDFAYYPDIVPDRYFLPESMGGGAAWFDFDRDGALDLYLANGCVLDKQSSGSDARHSNELYRNTGDGQFRPVTANSLAGDFEYGQGCAAGDYNADGFLDLYVGNYGQNTLLMNNGDGTFEECTDPAAAGDERWTTSVLWHDLNADGLLDLYLTNYLDVSLGNLKKCSLSGKTAYCGPGKYEAVQDRVLLNLGDGRFADATTELGFERANGKGLAIAAVDLDDDTRAEIYVANDMTSNFLFQWSGGADAGGTPVDNGLARYTNIASVAGCAVSDVGQNEASMGISCSDFDGDGRVDIFLTHFYAQKNTLYRNLGDLQFLDDSRRSRVAASSFQTLGFGTVPIDFDGDGADELFIANGHVLGPLHDPFAMHPQLLDNDGTGQFADVSDSAGSYFEELCIGRGAASGDFDNDGDADIVVTHLDRNVALLRDDSPKQGDWIGFDLCTVDRTHPAGTRVIVRCGDWTSRRSVTTGGSYLSWNDLRVRFALPKNHEADIEVEIDWSTGRKQIVRGLTAGTYWTVLEQGDVSEAGQ